MSVLGFGCLASDLDYGVFELGTKRPPEGLPWSGPKSRIRELDSFLFFRFSIQQEMDQVQPMYKVIVIPTD